MKLDDTVRDIMQDIINKGYECFLVGGAVRDNFLGYESKDYDLVTSIPLSDIPGARVMRENEHRNTAVLKVNGKVIELSAFRGSTIEEDLLNRDFKMNSIAVDINGLVIDPYEGLKDIKEKQISLTQDNGQGLIIDPLRILRAIRLAIKYNFRIDTNTTSKIHSKYKLLSKVSKERIITELKMILIYKDISKYLEEYQDIFSFITTSTYNKDIVSRTKPLFSIRLASLFLNADIDIFRTFSKNYKLDNKLKKEVSDLLLYYKEDIYLDKEKIYNFYLNYNMDKIENLFNLKEAYLNKDLAKELEVYIELRDTIKSISYSGSDLVTLGFKGKVIGNILVDIKREIVCGRLDNKKEVIDKYVLDKYKGNI